MIEYKIVKTAKVFLIKSFAIYGRYVDLTIMYIIHTCVCTYLCLQIYKKALTRQRILHPEEVGQLFPSLEDLVTLHGNLLVGLKDRVATSKDELVTHISDVLLQAVSLYICMKIINLYVCNVM